MIVFFAILTGICAALLVIAVIIATIWAVASLVRGWRAAGAVIRQTEQEAAERKAEVEAHIASVLASTCPLCRDGGHGRCTCTTDCGQRGCTFDHTSLSMLSAEDAAYLRGLGISEGDR